MGGGAEAGESGEVGVDDLKKKRFLWGVGLAWAPWIPTAIGLVSVFMTQKATGLGVVTGGLSELFVVWGIGAILIGQVAAIVLLSRAFSPGHWVRSLFSGLSICFSGLMLLLVGLFLWLLRFQTHHTP
jgi:hypothetical protein